MGNDMTFEKVLISKGLPDNFSPNHADWCIPSKRNKYNLAVQEYNALGISNDGMPHGNIILPIRPEVQSSYSLGSVKLSQATIGIAISTYFGLDTSIGRKEIFFASIYSLLASKFPGKIVIVDDGSITNKHLMEIADIKGIQIIYKHTNTGVSRTKNTGINALAGCEYLFLADDDLIYNGKWWEIYIDAYQKTKISHFAFRPPKEEFPWGRFPEDADARNGIALRRVPHPNGCMLFFHRSVIDMVGGFKVLPNKFGFEHLNMTERILKAAKIPFSYDVVGSNDFLHLNSNSYNSRSIVVKTEEIVANREATHTNFQIKEPIEE
jgi:glycosyltransferase involved in cell wall biosynthesis